jgi:hypothetical protein
MSVVFFIAFWLLFCFLVAKYAGDRGHSRFGWWLLAFLFSPLLAGLLLALVPNLRVRQCQFCAEQISVDAKICKHCRHETPIAV